MSNREFDEWQRERNAVLLEDDIDKLIAHMRKYSPHVTFPSREVAEIALHKARTACLDLPKDVRDASHDWLIARGYSSWGDNR